MRGPFGRHAVQLGGWLLTPVVAWAVALLGGWVGALVGGRLRGAVAGVGAIVAGALIGAVLGVVGWTLLMRRARGSPVSSAHDDANG